MFDEGNSNYRKYYLGLFDYIESVKANEFRKRCIGYGINVGCGISELGDVGVDSSATMLAQNKRKNKQVADAKQLPFPDKHFDYAFCSELLHHVDDPLAVVKEMWRVSKGNIVICEANIDNPFVWLFTRFLPFDKDARFYNKKRIEELKEDIFKHTSANHVGVGYASFLGVPDVWIWITVNQSA